MNKKEARVRRARKTRIRIALQRATRLVVSRSNCHIYAQIIAPTGDKVLASASTVEPDVRKDVKNGGNKAAAAIVGKRIGDRATGPRRTAPATARSHSSSPGIRRAAWACGSARSPHCDRRPSQGSVASSLLNAPRQSAWTFFSESLDVWMRSGLCP